MHGASENSRDHTSFSHGVESRATEPSENVDSS